jgi:hypothetical protein
MCGVAHRKSIAEKIKNKSPDQVSLNWIVFEN